MELVEEQKIPIPRSLMRVALSMMRRSVKKRAGFSIDEVAPIEQVQKAFIPCLFGKASLLQASISNDRHPLPFVLHVFCVKYASSGMVCLSASITAS